MNQISDHVKGHCPENKLSRLKKKNYKLKNIFIKIYSLARSTSAFPVSIIGINIVFYFARAYFESNFFQIDFQINYLHIKFFS